MDASPLATETRPAGTAGATRAAHLAAFEAEIAAQHEAAAAKQAERGKRGARQRVLALLDGMKANARFTEVKPLYLRRSDRGGREVSFAMSFRFKE